MTSIQSFIKTFSSPSLEACSKSSCEMDRSNSCSLIFLRQILSSTSLSQTQDSREVYQYPSIQNSLAIFLQSDIYLILNFNYKVIQPKKEYLVQQAITIHLAQPNKQITVWLIRLFSFNEIVRIQMKDNRHRFLRMFQKGSAEEQESIDPLTHSLPPVNYILNPNVTELLQKIRDSLSMVTALGSSPDFFARARKMMLLDTFQQENSIKTNHVSHNELYLSSKIQIVPSKPVEWIYGEIKLRKQDSDGSLSPIRINSRDLLDVKVGTSSLASLIGSAVILIEAGDGQLLNQIIRMLKEGQEKVGQLEGAFPKIVAIANKNQADCQLLLSTLRSRNIEVELVSTEICKGWEEQYRLISIGKSIIGCLHPKVLGKVAITAKLMNFLWSAIAASGDTFVPLQMWQEAQECLIQQQSQQALQQYMSRIQDITEGQGLLSESFFRDTEVKVRSDILRQVVERTGFSPENQNIMKTQRRLLEWKEELENRNSQAVHDWGRTFVREAWNTIEKKLCKEIKSIFALRQEIQILFEFFKKKSEEFISAELVMNFTQFLLPKILESTQTITNSIVSPLQEQQMTMQTQIINLAAEAKDLRRRASKEESELARRLQQSKEKYLKLEANYEASEKCLQLAKQQLSEIRQIYEQRIYQLTQTHQQALKQKNLELEESLEVLDSKSKELALLSSELNKQKLLHQQTKHFYQQTVQLLKSKEAQARNQLEEVSLTASRELCVIRQNSTKELDDYQSNNTLLLQKVAEQERMLIDRDLTLQKLQKQLQTLVDRLVLTENIESKVVELELRNKVLEDMEHQCEALRGKCKKIQEQQKRLLRQRDQHMSACQDAVTKALVIEERYELLSKQIESKQSKIQQLNDELEQVKQERQILKQKINRQARKIKADASIQVEDCTLKQNLRLALETINQLQEQYNRVKYDYQWKKRSRG